MADGCNGADMWKLIPDSEPVEAISESEHEGDRRWLFEDSQRVIEPELEIYDTQEELEEGGDQAGWAQGEEEPPSNLQEDVSKVSGCCISGPFFKFSNFYQLDLPMRALPLP